MVDKTISRKIWNCHLLAPALIFVACEPARKPPPDEVLVNASPIGLEAESEDDQLSLKATNEELLNPLVFNWQFYLQSNPDLLLLGLRTAEHAKNHWLKTGAAEGR